MGGKFNNELMELDGILLNQLTRVSPSTKKISPRTRKSIDRLVNRYIEFLDEARINSEVTSEVIKLARKKGFFKDKKNFEMKNRDKTAFALVKPGKKPVKEGLRIIYTHTDSPCLQVKPVPVRFEWSPDRKYLHLGVELSIIPYGGVVPYHWFGCDLEVRGWIFKKGRRRKIEFDADISDKSMHIDNRGSDTSLEDAFSWENAVLTTGDESEKKLIEWLEFTDKKDFARSRLYAVPKTKTARTKGGGYIKGYGHDDRAPTFAAVDALMSADPVYTAMVIGFDKEEVGSLGDGGADSNFFEQVLGETIARTSNMKFEDIPWGLVQKVIQNSYAISGDTDVGPSKLEVEGENTVDLESVGRLGFGVSVDAHDGGWETNQIPTTYVDKILCMMNRKLNKKHQLVGCAHDADNFEGQGYHADFFTKRGIPTMEIGILVTGLHSPVEKIHEGDFYYMRKAYQVFLEDKGK